AVEPEFLLRPDASVDPQRVALVTETATRFERNGLGVMIEIHPAHWRLEKSETDRAKLLLIWRGLALHWGAWIRASHSPKCSTSPCSETTPRPGKRCKARCWPSFVAFSRTTR